MTVAKPLTAVQGRSHGSPWSPPPPSLRDVRKAALWQLLAARLREPGHVRLGGDAYRMLRLSGYSKAQIDRALGELVESGKIALVARGGAVYVVRGDAA